MAGIRDILRATPRAIVRRGEDYFHGGCILSLGKTETGGYAATVSGSNDQRYAVRVETGPADDIVDYSCTCPYDAGDVCKHVVAVLLAIDEGDLSPFDGLSPQAGQPAARPDLAALLGALPKERLLSILLDHAKEDADFRDWLVTRLAPPDAENDMALVRERIRRVIQENAHGEFVDYEECGIVSGEMDGCLELAEDRLGGGLALSAFDIAIYVFLQALRLLSNADDSSGSLSGTLDGALETLREVCGHIAEKSGPEDTERCYDRFCGEAKGKALAEWPNWSLELLETAAVLATGKNRHKIEEALQSLHERDTSLDYSGYRQSREDMVRLSVIRRLDGKKAARAFIDAHLEADSFRLLAVEEDIRNLDYGNAERLCLERTRQPAGGHSSLAFRWWERLYGIYELTNDRVNLAGIAKALLLQGNLEYYEKLKAVLTLDGLWEESYPRLRGELKTALPSGQYAEILDREGEHALLLEEVKRNSRYVFRFGLKLARQYPATIMELYKVEITKAAKESTNRGAYSSLCGMLGELRQAGGEDEALALADGFLEQYRRRPAMVDELTKLKRRWEKRGTPRA